MTSFTVSTTCWGERTLVMRTTSLEDDLLERVEALLRDQLTAREALHLAARRLRQRAARDEQALIEPHAGAVRGQPLDRVRDLAVLGSILARLHEHYEAPPRP